MDLISNANLVISVFGYWPEFADSPITTFSISDEGTIELEIVYIDAGAGRKARIGLRFSGSHNINLHDLDTQNVIDRLEIARAGEIHVSLDACVGLCGEFDCSKVEVLHART